MTCTPLTLSVTAQCPVRRNFNRRARYTLSYIEGCQYKSPGQEYSNMNNTAKKINAESVEQPKASLEVVKKDEKAVVEVPSLEKRIQKVEDLSMLIEKWRKLTETRRNLQTFSLGADGLGATVFLRDASGKEFKTSNTPVVSAVMEEIKTTLDERIKEVETQIKF